MTKEIRLELINDKGEMVVHKVNFIPARKVREALEINVLSEEGKSDIEVMDKMLDFVASVFSDVTVDMILDGVASWDLIEVLQNVMSKVMGNEGLTAPEISPVQ